MKKRIKKLNLSRRNFLTGTATLAGIAATASVVPITIANANHTKGEKGLPDLWLHNWQGFCTHCTECSWTPAWEIHGGESGRGNILTLVNSVLL